MVNGGIMCIASAVERRSNQEYTKAFDRTRKFPSFVSLIGSPIKECGKYEILDILVKVELICYSILV